MLVFVVDVRADMFLWHHQSVDLQRCASHHYSVSLQSVVSWLVGNFK